MSHKRLERVRVLLIWRSIIEVRLKHDEVVVSSQIVEA